MEIRWDAIYIFILLAHAYYFSSIYILMCPFLIQLFAGDYQETSCNHVPVAESARSASYGCFKVILTARHLQVLSIYILSWFLIT